MGLAQDCPNIIWIANVRLVHVGLAQAPPFKKAIASALFHL